MKIAIVRLSSLGDIIFCMTSIQLIKRRFPDASITWICDGKFADILDYNPHLDKIVKIDLKAARKTRDVGLLRAQYRKLAELEHHDIAIDLHGMLKSAVMARFAAKHTAGFDFVSIKEPLAALLYRDRFRLPIEMNTVRRYAELAGQAIGFTVNEEELIDKEPFLFYGKDDVNVSNPVFREDKKNVIFVLGSTWESRNYPAENFIRIAQSLKENILLLYGNEAERKTAEYIAERSSYAKLLPSMDLNQLKAAISRADLVIGGDTGPTHIAWANNIPCVVIFGPTPPTRIYANKTTRILKSRSHVDDRKLNKNDFSIQEIKPDLVLQISEELLA